MKIFEELFNWKPRFTEGADYNKVFDIDTAILGKRAAEKAKEYAAGKSEKQVILDAQAGNIDAINYLFHKMAGIIYKGFKWYTGPNFHNDKKEAYLEYASEAYLLLKSGSTYTSGSPLETFDVSKYEDMGDNYFKNFAYYFKQYLSLMIRNWHKDDNTKGFTGKGTGDLAFSSIDFTGNDDGDKHAGNNKYADKVTDEYNDINGVSSMEDDVLDSIESESASYGVLSKFKDCAKDPQWKKSHGILARLIKAIIENPNIPTMDALIEESGLITEDEIQELMDKKGINRTRAVHTKYVTAKRNMTEILPAVLAKYGIDLNDFLSAIYNGEGPKIVRMLGI